MSSLYILIGIIIFFVVSLYISNTIQHRKGNTEERETPEPLIKININGETSGCCGDHDVCEKDSLIAAYVEEPEYFDDDELDRFSLRDASNYTESEVNEFREVFYTILDEEKPRWIRSLQLREISIPNQMKDEVVMVINELRELKMQPA